jgi:hypothetical protein
METSSKSSSWWVQFAQKLSNRNPYLTRGPSDLLISPDSNVLAEMLPQTWYMRWRMELSDFTIMASGLHGNMGRFTLTILNTNIQLSISMSLPCPATQRNWCWCHTSSYSVTTTSIWIYILIWIDLINFWVKFTNRSWWP